VLSTTLLLEPALGTDTGRSPVLVLDNSRTVLLASMAQGLSGRTAIAVLLGVIGEGLRIKFRRHSPALELARRLLVVLGKRADEVYPFVRRLDDVLAVGKAAVGDQLFGRFSCGLFDPFYRWPPFRRGARVRADYDIH